MLTKEETEIINILADVWNKYLNLPFTDFYRQQSNEFCTIIHHAQNHIAARPAYRELNLIKKGS